MTEFNDDFKKDSKKLFEMAKGIQADYQISFKGALDHLMKVHSIDIDEATRKQVIFRRLQNDGLISAVETLNKCSDPKLILKLQNILFNEQKLDGEDVQIINEFTENINSLRKSAETLGITQRGFSFHSKTESQSAISDLEKCLSITAENADAEIREILKENSFSIEETEENEAETVLNIPLSREINNGDKIDELINAKLDENDSYAGGLYTDHNQELILQLVFTQFDDMPREAQDEIMQTTIEIYKLGNI